MEALDRSILATLAYYGALRRPLTALELHRRLIPSSRLGASGADPGFGPLVSALQRLTETGAVTAVDGLHVLGDAPGDCRSRFVEREGSSAGKWHRMLRYARWFQAVPYVRMLAGAGSLALGSSATGSDWDVFAVVRSGRLYTARLGLLIAAALMGRLRTKRMRTAPDRFCFNHIITTDGLALRHRSLFTAHAAAWLVPFYDPSGYAHRLRQANAWLSEFVRRGPDERFEGRTIPASHLLGAVRWCTEFILNTFIGDLLEALVRRWMRRRIQRTPATHEKGGRIVADDRELEFHPHSFEAVALARYNTALTRLGLGSHTERDSGLTR